jgi:predicted PurR-regulated permease PerM
VLNEAGETLRHWLLGQALTMSVIFLFTWAGLWLIGVQPAFALGL